MRNVMTSLTRALSEYRQRAQFHDEPKLQAVIAAVRAEEHARYEALIEAARQVLSSVPTSEARGGGADSRCTAGDGHVPNCTCPPGTPVWEVVKPTRKGRKRG